MLGLVDLCDESRYFHGKPLLSFSAKTATPVVVIAFPRLVLLELRESNDCFATYIEREITHHALQARLPFQSMALQHMQEREDSAEAVPSNHAELIQASSNCNASASRVPGRQSGLEPHPPPTRRRRRSITGLQVENGRVVLAQPGTGVGSKPPRELCTAVFRNPLAAEAPF